MEHKLWISPGAFLMGALALLLLPARWWVGAFLAAAVHEIFHLLILWLMGGQVVRLRIGANGAVMDTTPMEPGREVLCALAGPAGSLMMAYSFSCFFPEACLCALVQGLYNLLPIYPLDGGRILRCFAPGAVCAAVEVFALIVLWGMGLWGSIAFDLGFLPLFPACIAAMQWNPRKYPCKESKLAVQ